MKTLIFDFDGTIADSFALVLSIAYELTGAEPLTAKDIARLRQLPLSRVIRMLHIPIIRLPGLLLRGRQRMHERINEVQPFEGMPETLRDLHMQGHHLLVISSNSEQNVRAFLREHNLETYFDGVYGNAAIFNKSFALKRVLRHNRMNVQDCYYIGDEVRDIIAATKARIEPVSVAWGYQNPNALAAYHPFALVHSPRELVEIFNRKS